MRKRQEGTSNPLDFITLLHSFEENPNEVTQRRDHAALKMLINRYNKLIPNVTRRDDSVFLSLGMDTPGTSRQKKRDYILSNPLN